MAWEGRHVSKRVSSRPGSVCSESVQKEEIAGVNTSGHAHSVQDCKGPS